MGGIQIVLICVALISAAVCGYCSAVAAARQPTVDRRPVLPPPASIPPQPLPPADAPQQRPERDDSPFLIKGLIGAYDVSIDEALRAHVEQVLSRVGVQRLAVAPGEAFNPELHEAVATVPTTDATRTQRVAETVRPGWRSGGNVIRPPQVAVWVADAGAVRGEGR